MHLNRGGFFCFYARLVPSATDGQHRIFSERPRDLAAGCKTFQMAILLMATLVLLLANVSTQFNWDLETLDNYLQQYGNRASYVADHVGLFDIFRNRVFPGEDRQMDEALEEMSSMLQTIEKDLKESLKIIRTSVSMADDMTDSVITAGQFESLAIRLFSSELAIRNCYEHWRYDDTLKCILLKLYKHCIISAYETTKTERAKEAFIVQSSNELLKAVNALLDGLLGTTIFGSDLLAVTQKAHQCHRRKVRQDADNYLGLVKIGEKILTAYYHCSQTPPLNQ